MPDSNQYASALAGINNTLYVGVAGNISGPAVNGLLTYQNGITNHITNLESGCRIDEFFAFQNETFVLGRFKITGSNIEYRFGKLDLHNVNNILYPEKSEFKIYPNPFTDFLSINRKEDIELLCLFDAMGNLVYKSNGNENYAHLNFGKLQDGLYTLTIKTKDGLSNYKVVKSN